jgi:hypothetical protein
LIAALTYFPVFQWIADTANPALSTAHQSVKVVVIADPDDCSFQFNPTGTSSFTNSCDVAKGALARASVMYTQEAAPAGTTTLIHIGDKVIQSVVGGPQSAAKIATFN